MALLSPARNFSVKTKSFFFCQHQGKYLQVFLEEIGLLAVCPVQSSLFQSLAGSISVIGSIHDVDLVEMHKKFVSLALTQNSDSFI